MTAKASIVRGKTPALSILLPIYNGETYLAPQLDSVLGQTLGDFELLVIDDGSTDGGVQVVDGYARRDKRIRRLASDGNHGQTNRLRELVGAATGTFVCICDQDDVWAADKNQRLVDGIGKRPLAFGRSALMDGAGADLGVTALQAIGLEPAVDMPLRAMFKPLVSAHAMIARRDWLSPASFGTSLPFDWVMGLEALFSGGLAYVDEAVVHHRIHSANQSNSGLLRGRKADRLTGSHLRHSLFFHRHSRLRFWLMLDTLGRSTALAPALRASIRSLAATAEVRWFSPWRRMRGDDAEFRGAIETVFLPLSTRADDRAYFAEQVAILTRGSWHLGNLHQRLRRFNQTD